MQDVLSDNFIATLSSVLGRTFLILTHEIKKISQAYET